jgi:D-tyrosyl-tRNA(Tyr) deacylase
MRAILQRVTRASVEVEGKIVGEIRVGLMVLLGVAKTDSTADADTLAAKIVNLRIFADEVGKMNLSLIDSGGALLVVSQFTLYGDCRKGRRPGFDAAAPAEQARELYERFVTAARQSGVHVETGVFQAHMAVSLINDGPVTFVIESASDSALP